MKGSTDQAAQTAVLQLQATTLASFLTGLAMGEDLLTGTCATIQDIVADVTPSAVAARLLQAREAPMRDT